MFLDRQRELTYLESRYRRPNAEFAVLYGRRRVGKSTLIYHWCEDKPHLYFFAARLSQEGLALPPREATERALVHTGPVISSCGLIMAATLGSMMVGDVKMLQQLGFALALGMLIDTFVVRPLLLPSFIVLTGRTLARSSRIIR